MAIRMLEVLLPNHAEDRVEALLEGKRVLRLWHDRVSEDRILVKAVIRAEDADDVMGILSDAYAGTEGFGLILLPVEAIVPRPEAEETPDVPEQVDRKKRGSRIGIEELYSDVADMIRGGRIFFVLVFLSTIVAAVGLARDNVAVIIGAMVIAPLLGPNVALSLATTMGDLKLALRSTRANLAGAGFAFALALAFGFYFGVNPEVPQLASRTRVDLSDIVLALASGSAGALSLTTGLGSALVGVMVAVALLPPLVAFGLLLGAGYPDLAWAALLLLAVNVVSVNLAGVVTFMAQGVRPRLYWEGRAAKRATVTALAVWALVLAVFAYLIVLTGPFER